MNRRLMVSVAGEASGDLIAAPVIEALRAMRPDLRVAGVLGPRMRATGAEPWFDASVLSVRGYLEALSGLPAILALRKGLLQRVAAEQPALYLGIDAPDFNLSIEEGLRQKGIHTVHLVCPSIWGWRPERIHKIRRAVGTMLCVFPFEPALLKAAGVDAAYIGHPLADAIPWHADPAVARVALGLRGAGPVVAVMPGSRLSEARYNGPAFLGAAKRLLQRRPGLQCVIPAATEALRRVFEGLPEWPALRDLGAVMVDGQSHLALQACDVTLIASGTATLEAALYKRPMVIAYRVPQLAYWMMMRHKRLPWIGLPNILAGETLVPELLQYDCNAESLAKRVLYELDRPNAEHAQLREKFERIHVALRQGMAQRAAEVLSERLS